MSNHSCPVVHVVLSPHPNADKLAMVNGILGGYNCGVSKEQFKSLDRGVFIPPDSLVPVAHPHFKFLETLAYREPHPYAGYARITVKKFRGLYSDGLLVPAPDGMPIGADAAETLGVKHYEPLESVQDTRLSADAEGIEGFGSKYDIENLKRYLGVFRPGELVVATEKIHGCNARYAWRDGRFWVGSRSHWKKEGDNVWWASFTDAMRDFVRMNPGLTLFGEVYGKVQSKFPYDAPGGQKFVAFDIFDWDTDRWVNHDDALEMLQRNSIPCVPEVYRGPFDYDHLKSLAEGPSVLAPGAVPCREGIVIKALPEKYSPILGRHQLKLVGNGYLELKE